MRLVPRGVHTAHPDSSSWLAALAGRVPQTRANAGSCALGAVKPIVVQPMSCPNRACSDCCDFATRRASCAEAPRTGCNTIRNTRTTSNERNAVLTLRTLTPRQQNYAYQPEHHSPRQQPTGSDLATPHSADTQMNTPEPGTSGYSGVERRPDASTMIQPVTLRHKKFQLSGPAHQPPGSTRPAGGDA